MSAPSAARAQAQLVALLQLAFSGEKAAAWAYRGHAASLGDACERERIRAIEQEEWQHRTRLGEMLLELGASPRRLNELRAAMIGRTLGALCHVCGRFLPMYGAGRLESRNIREYETAARLALACGREAWVDCLLTMAEVEWEHEKWFRDRVLAHWIGARIRLWPEPAARSTIRDSMPGRTRAAERPPEVALNR
ncbi:MAG: ferritin-like domain-containing protein [Planctomycetota bacterium]